MLAFGFLKPHELSPRLQRLKNLALFSTLTPRELKIADGLLHKRRFLAGEIIFDEGEEGQALYIVLSGAVSVCRNHILRQSDGCRTFRREFFRRPGVAR